MEETDFERFSNVTCLKETANAILVDISGRSHWIPKSQISDDSEVYQIGNEGELIVSSWFCEKEGIE